MPQYDVELDTTGLNCPLPVLKTKKALSTMSSGQLLHVISTDPASSLDFAGFCAQSGNVLVEERRDNDKFYFTIRKK